VEYSGTKIGLVEYSGTRDWSRGIFGDKNCSRGILGDKRLVSWNIRDKRLVSWNIRGQKIGLVEYRGQNHNWHLKLLAFYSTTPNLLHNNLTEWQRRWCLLGWKLLTLEHMQKVATSQTQRQYRIWLFLNFQWSIT